MSFILDALKKSETERQRQSSTEFTSVPTSARKTNAPRWLWIVGALLLVNLVVLLGVFFRPDNGVVDPAAESSTSVSRNATSFEERVAAAQQNTPQRQDRAPISEAPRTPAVESVRPDIVSQQPSSVDTSNAYPSIHEVRASGTISVPELHLDIHVYSDVPKDRFVFINMSKHREGSQLPEGPVVAEITPEGVILGHLGQSFLLTRE